MNKSTAWRFCGWIPLIAIFLIYVIYLISLDDLEGLILMITIIGILYLAFWWGSFCSKQEYEAKRKEGGKPESFY